ncbi:hypothetical protein SERLA73DRAFT_191084 [Serpula lacrymans var. lacrymans S7.3]|uniref:F-box domain-containing protein n=2 Tax=Serpula lacrymans var. lacrymans TaxID=341189 RepID=F8QGW5_SERL3|nr:uncharacterized protein SERLADRAFT_480681 [Serpula lacrymans var. lacrymans S7.9]EGN92447.1 hypothetical protein SERLA73DRAFT_191084 [Serpula lacrymans var. lacrymans S7.3]EGO18574.1 hypothetical protein SERLADRAFT_480681 [Serpula lacrymans var. lacrymans S7.9]
MSNTEAGTSSSPSRKRSRATETPAKSPTKPEAEVRPSPKKARRKPKSRSEYVPPGWTDIPTWQTNKSFLMDLPLELWDKIFGPASSLTLQDHLSFSGTCRQIRRAYTEDVWKTLKIMHQAPNHLFTDIITRNPQHDESPDVVLGSLIQTYKANVIIEVNWPRVTTVAARSEFKLTEKELLSLPYTTRRNPQGPNTPIREFYRARVRALAYRIHGGPLGHIAHLKKVAERNKKAKATREKNGTLPKKRVKPASFCTSGLETGSWEASYDVDEEWYDDF